MKLLKFFAAFFIIFSSGFAHANFKYAVIDYETLVQKSKAFIDLEKKFEAKRGELLTSAQQKEKQLNKKEELVKMKCSADSPAVCEALTKANNAELIKLNELYSNQRKALNDKFAAALSEIDGALNIALQEIVQQHNYNIVFHKKNLLYADNTSDITYEVLKILNGKLSVTHVKF